jgi:PKD repeat protein
MDWKRKLLILTIILIAVITVPVTAEVRYGAWYNNTTSTYVSTIHNNISELCGYWNDYPCPSSSSYPTFWSSLSCDGTWDYWGHDWNEIGWNKSLDWHAAKNNTFEGDSCPVYSYPYCCYMNSGTEHYELVYDTNNVTRTTATALPPPIPVCSFTASPLSGPSPLSVLFADTSTNSPTSWQWQIIVNETGTVQHYETLQSWVNYMNGDGLHFDVNLTATNAVGSCNLFKPAYISTTNATGKHVVLFVKDATTGQSISNAQVGIYNGTENSWFNTTTPTGIETFTGTGASQQYTFSVGETLLLAASAAGYRSASLDGYDVGYSDILYQADYQTATILLTPSYIVPAPGTCNLVVTVLKDNPAHCVLGNCGLQGALVSLSMSGSNIGTGTADNNGVWMAYNLTPGQIKIDASDVWYQSQTQFVSCLGDQTLNATFSMVMLGETPVPTTGVPTIGPTGGGTTAVPTTTFTGVPTSGNVTCTGFWSPFCTLWGSMGATTPELPLIMTAFLVIGGLMIGALITRLSVGAMAGAAIGFLLATAAGWISVIYIIAIILISVFVWIFFIK